MVTTIEEFMRQIRYPLGAQILDQRSQVLKEACVLLGHLSRALSQSTMRSIGNILDKFIEYFLTKEGLFKVLHSGKTALHELAHICIKSILTNLSSHFTSQTLLQKILNILSDQMTSKTTQVRVYISEYIYQSIINQKIVIS